MKQINKSPSAQRKSDGLPRTPSQMSYSEFIGRTPQRKSVGDKPGGCLNPITVPLEPKKTNCPEEEEFTVHDHGIMLLLGNGRRTKPRTKGKSVCMAPEKSDVHLITPMVGKTQSIPRTPPPHGEKQVDDTPPPTDNIVLKSPPPPLTSGSLTAMEPPSDFQKPISVPAPKRPVVSVPESPMPSPEKPSKTTTNLSSDAIRRSKSSDKYFGFEIDDDDSVFQTKSPAEVSSVPLGAKTKGGILSRKSLMECKPKSPKTGSQSSQNDSSSEPVQFTVKNSQMSKHSRSVKKKNRIESESDEMPSPKTTTSVKSKRSERSKKSQSRTRHASTDKEDERSSDSSPTTNSNHKTPGPTKPAAKTPAPAKSVKSTKGKSTKKTTKTPGTTKKVLFVLYV